MPANPVVQARIDRDIVERAKPVLKKLGLSVSDAMRIMLTRIAEDQSFPIELRTPNAETIAAMEEARRGGGEIVTLEQLRAELRADD